MDPCAICGESDFTDGLAKGRHMKSHNRPDEVIGGPDPRADAPASKPKGLRVLNLPSTTHSNRAIRGKKYMVAACLVFDPATGQTVTGPCRWPTPNWWLTCAHGGPAQDELEALGWPGSPRYYDAGWEERTTQPWKQLEDGSLIAEGDPVVTRVRVVKPRIEQVSASRRNSTGAGPAVIELNGGRPVEDFGIAPFCEFWNCYRQETRAYANGRFCSEVHARYVYLDEHGIVVPIGDGEKAQEIRAQVLDGAHV